MLHTIKYNSLEIARNIETCRTKISQMFGLMFRSSIPSDYATIFVMKKPSSVGIHMLFMRFPIDVIFLDEEKNIIGLSHLKPWTGHSSMKNVKYVIETNPGAIGKYKLSIGGKMEFEDV
ncbi:MAG: DUF192 domain-containing protein [Candidatus Methanoperedens sp.]|nr:DUF192 domain-containing protein [Candidatus Methanoperedens sp.]